jgi:hypothetical protein
MDLKRYALPAASGLLAWALFVAWLWQPERQVRLHQKHFLHAVERRNWSALEKFIATDYRDRWEHDRDFLLDAAREVFGQFLFLEIEQRIDECVVEDSAATARAVVKISGSGGPAAQAAMTTVNGLREPFAFTWQRRSGKPWDWQLTRLDHRELDLDHVPLP